MDEVSRTFIDSGGFGGLGTGGALGVGAFSTGNRTGRVR